ncbi:MAG: protein phosphatase 2C domain-containing protein [Bacteroidales bacterium]|nr:protein phosphatase 2C domain-containing protein [Bacteroidales bacterium]
MEYINDLLKKVGIELTDSIEKDFSQWKEKKMWNDYIKEYMDIKTKVQNEINSFPIGLPNAKKGEQYFQEVNFKNEKIESFWFEGLSQIGCNAYITEKGFSILGMPTNHGDFKIKMCYKLNGWVEGKPILERSFNISVNPDPKDLWKNIPTPKDIEYFKDDEECGYVKVEALDGTPRKDIVAASKRGRSHAHEGRPRDDHFKLHYCAENDWYVIAVADGAGSAPFSREGSKIACDVSVKHCMEMLKDSSEFEKSIKEYKLEINSIEKQKQIGNNVYKIVGNAAFKAYKTIENVAQEKKRLTKEYATTLLLAVCKKFDFGWFISSFWVGDGALCIYDKERQYIKIMGTPDGGEFAGQTKFLTMPEIFSDTNSFIRRLNMTIESDFTALMLMTDGVSDPMFETDANLNKIEKWNDLWENITKYVQLIDDNVDSKNQLLNWLDFWSKGNHDDRTIAILY